MSLQNAAAALSFIPPHDRETWVRMGMAIKSEFLEDGFDTWNAWSQGAESYNEKSARVVWRSIRAAGRIGVGTLYHEASANGWRDNGEHSGPLTEQELAERRRKQAARAAEIAAEDARKLRGYRSAASAAQKLIEQCELKTHYYLNSKGLPDAIGLVNDLTLVVPMRHMETNQIVDAQKIDWIPASGAEPGHWLKKNQTGMQARGAVLRLGPPKAQETFLCEGYATGLSIELAVRRMRLNASVLICFSDSNMVHVSPMVKGPAFVIADNDASTAGEKAARKIGLPWAMSDRLGEDANDLHQRAGLMAVCALLMAAKRAPMS